MGFVPMTLWIFYFSGGHGDSYPPTMILVGFLTSLVVGAFEEYAFRGPLLAALRQHLSIFNTIVLSNLLFVIYHLQSQPVHFWIAIFLAGVIFANLRFRGLSIGWIALIHGLIDTFMFMFPRMTPDPFSFHALFFQAGLLAYVVVTFPHSKNLKLRGVIIVTIAIFFFAYVQKIYRKEVTAPTTYSLNDSTNITMERFRKNIGSNGIDQRTQFFKNGQKLNIPIKLSTSSKYEIKVPTTNSTQINKP